MPVKDTQQTVTGKCGCCGYKTRRVIGTVFLEHGWEGDYLAVWTDRHPDNGMAFLIGPEDIDGFVSVLYSFEHGSFMVVGKDGYDWGETEGLRILDREDVIGSPLGEQIFELLDEIWICDRAVRRFHKKWSKA